MGSVVKTASRSVSAVVAALAIVACAEHRTGAPPHGEIGVAVPPESISGNTSLNAGPTSGVSGGPNLLGVNVPTKAGIIARIQNGLGGNVSPTAGNFARGVTQTSTNLPNAADVTKASGFDQVQLLAFAACSDLTTGNPSMMKSRYGVDPNATVTVNQSALIAAGIAMLDLHTAGLASQGPSASQVNTIFTTLVQAQSSATSTIAFMAVCIAANTAGAAMLGI